MNIPQIAALAWEHWKKTNPEMIYRQMVENKALITESEATARLTQREMDEIPGRNYFGRAQ